MELWTTPETHHNVGAVRAASSSAGLSEHSGDTCTPRTRRKIKKTEKTINGTGTGTASRSIAQHTHLYRTQVQVCPGRTLAPNASAGECRGVQVSSSAGPPPGQAQKNKNIPETITGTGTSASGGVWQPMARLSNTGATGVKRFEALFAYARDWAVTDCEDRRTANKRVGRLEKRACWTTSDADTREVKWGRPALAGRARQVRAGDLARHDKNAWPLRGDQTFVMLCACRGERTSYMAGQANTPRSFRFQ